MSLLLSIILPVYNAEMYLKRCINSVLRQDFNNFELIIVNDGSNDKSQDICEYYSRIDNRIKLYNQINSGVAVARNTGLEKANGDYILFIDSDDWLDYDMISSMINIFTSYECDLVSCNYYINSSFDEHKNGSSLFRVGSAAVK
jgi:glycosyltransferase involved in cell wall biosynthesis